MKFLGSVRILVALTVFFNVAGPLKARAATTNLLPVADTHISDALPTSNFGAGNPLLVGISLNGSPIQRGLFKFSLDAVPPGAIVTGATLRLIAVAGPREASSFDLNRLLVDWTEGGATWGARLPGTSWSAAGASPETDFVASPSATAQLTLVPMGGAPTTNNFTSAGMLADIQMWLDNPGTNFGWILHATDAVAGTGRQLASRENVAFQPLLILEYTATEPPATPTPPTLSDTMLDGAAIRFSFNAESNHTYTVESADSFTNGNWSTLTNIPAQPADTTIHITNSIGGSERYFRVGTP